MPPSKDSRMSKQIPSHSNANLSGAWRQNLGILKSFRPARYAAISFVLGSFTLLAGSMSADGSASPLLSGQTRISCAGPSSEVAVTVSATNSTYRYTLRSVLNERSLSFSVGDGEQFELRIARDNE